MKKPRICFGHFFLEFLGPNEASKAQNPFFCHIFLAIVIAWQFKCGDFDKLKNATNLLHFNLDFVTFWLKFFFEQKTVGVKYHQLTTTKVVVVFCCYLAFTVYDITKLGDILVK